MYVNTPKDPMLSSSLELTGDYTKDREILNKWLNDSIRRTEEAIKQVYRDIVVGTVKHKIVSLPDVPAAADLEDGQIVLQVAGTQRLYVKMSGTIVGVDLAP